MNPIGVGFLDLNPEGLFHLERMRLREDFHCLAGWHDQRDPRMAHGVLERVTNTPDELIDDPQVELLWIGPAVDSSVVGSVLRSGKHVLIGLPPRASLSTQSWRDTASALSDSKLLVAALHRWDGQFQTVLEQVRRGDLGQITDVRRVSRQYVPAELGSKSSTGTDATFVSQRELQVRQTKWFEMLDELLLLVDEPVVSVLAHLTGGVDAGGHRPGRCVSLEFASGCRAWLELNRLSLAPLETGWILDGTAGGFADGKRFRTSSEFELIDVPVDERPTDQSAFYASIVAAIRNGDEFAVTLNSIRRVLRLSEMIEQSLQTGQAVVVEDAKM